MSVLHRNKRAIDLPVGVENFIVASFDGIVFVASMPATTPVAGEDRLNRNRAFNLSAQRGGLRGLRGDILSGGAGCSTVQQSTTNRAPK